MYKYLFLFSILFFYSCANPSADSLCNGDPCNESPHRTVCKPSGDTYKCLCEAGYKDKYGICIKETNPNNACSPNPCKTEHRTVCNSDNELPICLCDNNFHDENGSCVSNTRTATCKNNQDLPKDSHEIVKEIEIKYEDNQWQPAPYCEIECNEGFNKDDNGICISSEEDPCDQLVCGDNASCDAGVCLCNSGFHKESETCIANIKETDCNDVSPTNATKVDRQVEIRYVEGTWTTPENCTWTCNTGYHVSSNGNSCEKNELECNENQHEENGNCVNNTKMVDCNNATPDNATKINAQVEITYNTGTGWSTPADCSWVCENNFHKEENSCSSNSKQVDCDASSIPDDSTKINSQVQIVYTEGSGWSIPATCDWTCNINFHKESNQCLSNTKFVSCNENTPNNATTTTADVEITYTEGSGWSSPADCAWGCNTGYHEDGNICVEDGLNCNANQHEEDNQCVSNTKTVPCNDITPANATVVNTNVEVTYTDGSGWSTPADCAWNCNTNYHEENNLCVEDGTIACDDEFESNNTYDTASLIEDANARSDQYTNLTICENDEDWFKIESEANSGLEIDIKYTHVPFECDIDMKLYKMENGELTQIDSSIYSTGRETLYVRNTLTSETYYIKVFGYASNCDSPYSLTANIFNNCIDDEESSFVAEQDDVLEEAKSFNLNTQYNRMLCDYDDDWYQYYFNTGDSIKITLDLIVADGDLDISLYDADGAQLIRDYGVGDHDEINYDILTDGNYFIKVEGWQGATNNYTLKVIKKEIDFDTGPQNYPLADDACKIFEADFSSEVDSTTAVVKSFKIVNLLLTHEYLSDINMYLAIGDENYTQIWTSSTNPSSTLDNNRDDDDENDADIELINRSYDYFNDNSLGDKKLRLRVCDDYLDDTGELNSLHFLIEYKEP